MSMEHSIIIDRHDPTPIYAQIAAQVALLVDMGAWNIGDRVPSVRGLAITLRINPMTVQSAYRQLQSEGYLEARMGHGVFVCGKKRDDIGTGFSQDVREVMLKWKNSGLSPNDMKKIAATEADNIAK